MWASAKSSTPLPSVRRSNQQLCLAAMRAVDHVRALKTFRRCLKPRKPGSRSYWLLSGGCEGGRLLPVDPVAALRPSARRFPGLKLQKLADVSDVSDRACELTVPSARALLHAGAHGNTRAKHNPLLQKPGHLQAPRTAQASRPALGFGGQGRALTRAQRCSSRAARFKSRFALESRENPQRSARRAINSIAPGSHHHARCARHNCDVSEQQPFECLVRVSDSATACPQASARTSACHAWSSLLGAVMAS